MNLALVGLLVLVNAAFAGSEMALVSLREGQLSDVGDVAPFTNRNREGTAGRLKNPARPAQTRTPALRISHFPDPHQRRYAPGDAPEDPPRSDRLTTEAEPM